MNRINKNDSLTITRVVNALFHLEKLPVKKRNDLMSTWMKGCSQEDFGALVKVASELKYLTPDALWKSELAKIEAHYTEAQMLQ